MDVYGHTFSVIAQNGNLLSSAASGYSTLVFNAAERVDFILCANAPIGKYLIQYTFCPGGACVYGGALLAYAGSSSQTSSTIIGAEYNTYNEITVRTPHPHAAAEILLPTTMGQFEINAMWPSGADTYFQEHGSLPTTWPQNAQKFGRPWTHEGEALVARCASTEADPVFRFDEAIVLDLLIVNLISADHSMHLHGHDVFIVDRGHFVDPLTGVASPTSPFIPRTGAFNTSLDDFCSSGTSITNPFTESLFRLSSDIVSRHGVMTGFLIDQWACTVDARQYQDVPLDTLQRMPTDIVWVKARSWAVLRVKLNNPGIWPVHCHQQMHVSTGMMAVFDVMPQDQPSVPHEVLRSCPCEGSSDDDDDTVWMVVFAATTSFLLLAILVMFNAYSRVKSRYKELKVSVSKAKAMAV